MKNNGQTEEEFKYLEDTLSYLRSVISKEKELIAERKKNLIVSRREMWENSAHHSEDFEKMADVNVHLTGVTNEASSYLNTLNIIEKYEKMIEAPYFGRFDYLEDGSRDVEKIYLGLHNVMDVKLNNILVYDWRAPISSVFYQYELGRVAYKSPMGELEGEVSLKRQYKIEKSVLKYFFDCSLNITDELLQEALSHNTTAKMKNIVETIQREQDAIIRDLDNEVLIVQGVAGSGKTSIALHRIAFLLYYGTNSGLGSNNITIISPNGVFGNYISSVLPELGEDNVGQLTFDDIIGKHLNNKMIFESRSMQLEYLISDRNEKALGFKRENIKFKGSSNFTLLLKRLIQYYERRVIPIEDVYYGGEIIASKQELKNLLLNNKINIPLTKRLNTMENRILDRLHPLQRNRLERIKKIVSKSEEHQLEVGIFSRLISVKETNKLMKKIHGFTKVDYFELYKMLFNNDLLKKLSRAMELPMNIEEIISETKKNLEEENISYEDSCAICYLKLLIEGSDYFSDIKQIVIDEAQDYYPIQYEIFKILFSKARFTVLGDVNQRIDKEEDRTFYGIVEEILGARKTISISLNKSYRSSCEINEFNQKILNKNNDFVSFERHEKMPDIISMDREELLDEKIISDIKAYRGEGFESIAVICKSHLEAEKLFERIGGLRDIKILNYVVGEMEKGTLIIPSYMSKGLEFDVVLVYGVSKENYSNEFDRRLLYIACTRALHRLRLYCLGEKSELCS